ncbi:MAG: RimK family alpha-L-glutamate ligase [Gammaproteobacteria bacterium]
MTLANQIAIITDDPGWHGRQLKAAFAQRGFESEFVSLIDCHLAVFGQNSVRSTSISIPGFDPEKLAGVFVRGVPGGTLEQVIMRLNVLHALYETGTVVYNNGRAIERTVDKMMTSLILSHQGLPTPDTWVCESEAQARAVILEQTGKGNILVMKPLFGLQGLGLIKIESLDDLPEDLEIYGGVFYLQRFIDRTTDNFQDWRVFVINGRAEAMMLRTGEHWITNRSQGAKCVSIKFDQQLADLAEAAVNSVEIDYAGVDLMQDEQGHFLVTEVNSVPAWWGLQKVCEFNIAERLSDHFLSRVAASQKIQVLK